MLDLLDSISLLYVRNCTRRINLFFQLIVKETIFIPRLKKLIDYYPRRVIVAKQKIGSQEKRSVAEGDRRRNDDFTHPPSPSYPLLLRGM